MRASEPLVIVAVGSNLGDPRRNVLSAIAELRHFALSDFSSSSLWQTDPVDCPPGSPHFVNAVVSFVPEADLTPELLLVRLQQIEKQYGRAPKKVPNEARPLDLDLIAFGNVTRTRPELILPHPRAHQRRFVLEPLNEIARDLVLPGHRKTVAQLLSILPAGPCARRIP